MIPAIDVQALAKGFTLHLQGGIGFQVLKSEALTVMPGECVALTGPSGAGKSTLMRCLQGNVENLGVQNEAGLVKDDVLKVLKRPPQEPYNLVFMDPPYRKKLAEPALRLLAANGWLAPGAFVTAEIEKEARFAVPQGFTLETDRLLGQTRVCIWMAS